MKSKYKDENIFKTYETIDEFFRYYLLERNIDKALSIVSDDIYSIGTGYNEIAIGKQSLKKLMQAEIDALNKSITYKIKDFHEKSKCQNCWDCFFTMEMHVDMGDGNKAIYSTRFTGSLTEYNGKLLIESAHMSESSVHQEEDEFFPIKFVSEKINTLNKQTQSELWKIFYHMLPAGIMGSYLDKDFPLYMINEQTLKMSGYTYEEFIEETNGLIINSIHNKDRIRVEKTIRQSLENGNQFEVEYRMKTRSGDYIWVYNIGRKTMTQDGKPAIIGMLVDISQKIRDNEMLMDETIKDVLTGVYNRKGLENRLKSNIGQNSLPYAFIMVDLDNFKKLNDIYGHIEGDNALKCIAFKIKEVFRQMDTVCRLGGDEFSVFIPNCTSVNIIEDKIKSIIDFYKTMISEKYPESNSSVSFGGVYCNHINTFDELYRKADMVLYDVKKTQKGSFQIKKE